MNTASPDRRIATGVVATVAIVFAILIAAVPKPHRPQDLVLRDVVQLLVLGDRHSARIEYTNERTDENGRRSANAFTSWYRPDPFLRLRLAGDQLEVETDRLSAQCGETESGTRCTRVSTRSARDSSAGLFFAVRATQTYAVADAASRVVAQRRARCFVFTRRASQEPIGQLGDTTELCLSETGVVLRSETISGSRRDLRVATAVVDAVSAAEVQRVMERHARPSKV